MKLSMPAHVSADSEGSYGNQVCDGSEWGKLSLSWRFYNPNYRSSRRHWKSLSQDFGNKIKP